MTAPIVLSDARHEERKWFPDHRFDGDMMHALNASVGGQLWERVSEGKRNADLSYPLYKRRHLLGLRDD